MNEFSSYAQSKEPVSSFLLSPLVVCFLLLKFFILNLFILDFFGISTFTHRLLIDGKDAKRCFILTCYSCPGSLQAEVVESLHLIS